MSKYTVTFVRPMKHLRLAVGFEDGLTGEVVLEESHLFGVFATLRDPERFAQVRCERGFVEWPGDIDLAPDAMHEEIKARGRWVLS